MNYYAENSVRAKRAGATAAVAYAVVLVLLLLLVHLNLRLEQIAPVGTIEVEFVVTDAQGGAATEGVEAAGGSDVPSEPAPAIPVPPVRTQSSNSTTEVPVSGSSNRPVTSATESTTTPEQPTINPNALFTNTSAQSGSGTSATSTATAGSGSGTTGSGRSDMDFDLEGRSAVGGLARPAYNVQEAGTVIIEIKVDQAGRVTGAKYRTRGSTTQNSELVEAARAAALATRFSPSENTTQSGTITYIFKLR